MDIGLTVKITYEDSDVVEVRVRAWNGNFGGATDAYIATGHLQEAAVNLRGFPKDRTDTRDVVFGAFGADSAGGGARIHLFCTNVSAHISARVEIESEYSEAGISEYVSLLLPIEAAALDLFVKELVDLRRGSAEAYLRAELT